MKPAEPSSYSKPLYAKRAPQLLGVELGGSRYQLRILSLGRERYDTNSGWEKANYLGGHRHDLYHLVLYTSGHNRVIVGGERHAVAAPALVVVSPGERHEFRPQADSVYSYTQITLALESETGRCRAGFDEMMQALFAVAPRAVRYPAPLDPAAFLRLRAHMDEVIEHIESAGGLSLARAHCSLTQLLFLIMETVHGNDQTLQENPVDRVRREIERRYMEPLTIDELAALACMSKGHFQRMFKSRFGTSPIAYCRQLRIEAAAHFLTHSNASCQEAAERVGFDDVYYFTRTFKQLKGVPPGRYRRMREAVGPEV
jgi:AraC-like DNA-binding protein